ncbi:substrate-binding domain-containing protein [Pseudomarimonas arenosa]|uniref:Phosphate ABC transporter substrate-binding/OmpA family protein n=1 Tax=Pseudomarimonas arenosa TaxID=2774145 RepID=A0AAW3ZPN3_9GAMM|nr:phosphate ABC transporter substrate-binding/OmpA family protein [Pseudomarimonas arenosa]MBD8526251.1 phosphate ABC transporter substrate-binding/OmpA family protein [Pseudomarimonas arenosa]
MRRLTCLLGMLLLVSSAGGQERLRLHGSNTIGEALAPAMVERWLRAEGYDQIQRREIAFEEIELIGRAGSSELVVEIHAHGSSTGFVDVAAGRADIAMSSRPVRASDRALSQAVAGLDRAEQEIVLAMDGLALIVHPSNPLRGLSKGQIRQIFSGQLSDWSQLSADMRGRIRVHARDDRSGTYDSFRAMVLGDADVLEGALRYESTEKLAQAVAADPLAIGFVGLSGVRGVRALEVSDGAQALAPSVENVAVEDYPLSRRLYLYAPEPRSPIADRFLRFAVSDQAQPLVESVGLVSQAIRRYQPRLRQDAPEEYHRLVKQAERLSLNLRFGTGMSVLDGKNVRDLDRLERFMQQPEQRGRSLILLGFSDANETLPIMALRISGDRADFVAQLLVQRGIDPARVRGLGGAAPVASNDNDLGRQRNRRVEVWLGQAAPGVASRITSRTASKAAP